MHTAKSSDDDATDRRLWLLIGLAVVLALCSAGWNIWSAGRHPDDTPNPALLVGLCAAIFIANRVKVPVRVRSNIGGYAWGEVPVLLGLLLIPAPWVVLCVAIAILAFKLWMLDVRTRDGRQKTIFAVAKETTTATVASLVLVAFDVRPHLDHPRFAPVAIVTAYLAIAVVDQALFLPVMATAQRTTILDVARTDWDIKWIGDLFRLTSVMIVVATLANGGDPLLLVVVPLLIGCVHLWHSRKLRTRTERESWKTFSQSIDALNVVELTRVLHLGATSASSIFSADEAEIDLARDGRERVVRGGKSGVTFDGAAPAESGVGGRIITARLETHDHSYYAGELRLRFHGSVTLNEFELYKLTTFASALCTAIRNASAYDELQRIAAENAYAATHDQLTGLINRRALLDQAGQIFANGRDDGVAALLLIDLNHFKEVNDTLGHAAGDKVLCEVARRLRSGVRSGDNVARLGGDEFAVLLTGLPTPAVAGHRAEAMLAALDSTIEVDGMQLTVEAAGGIALAAGTGGVEELLRRADVAMYQAKRAGLRTATYMHARDTADVERLILGGELSRAVAEHEFVVDFQPIVDLATGEVISAEALTRWHHPDHGALTPMQFLETVERSGQLPAFADAVLEQSLTAVGAWRDAGFDLPVAVNVSPRSLLDPEFPASVLAQLARHGVPADRLVLELAETLTISQLEVVARALGELRDAGVRLALDDFGTGFSSLSVLSRLPVHQLKIDREFVRSVETSSEATAVVRSTVDLARSLQLTVIAEGVESEPQRRTLWELGCVAGQGHLFARPMRAARMLAALQRGSGGQPGVLATPLYDAGSVVRLPHRRPPRSALPH